MFLSERIHAKALQLLLEELHAFRFAAAADRRVAPSPHVPVQRVFSNLHDAALVVEVEPLGGVFHESERTRIIRDRTQPLRPPPLRLALQPGRTGDVELRVRVGEQDRGDRRQVFLSGVLCLVDHQPVDVIDATTAATGTGPIPDDPAVTHLDHLLTGAQPLALHFRAQILVLQQTQHALLGLRRQQNRVMDRVQDRLGPLHQTPELRHLELVALAVLAGHRPASCLRRPTPIGTFGHHRLNPQPLRRIQRLTGVELPHLDR